MARSKEVAEARSIAGDAVADMSDEQLADFLDLLHIAANAVLADYENLCQSTKEATYVESSELSEGIYSGADTEPIPGHSGQGVPGALSAEQP